MEGVEVKVVDATGQDVPCGEDGEVVVRGRNVTLGYFEDELAKHASTLTAGRRRGDVGRLDEHWFLTITDRIKDMVTVGGFNVYPVEVEKAILGHAAVSEAAVVAVPDELLGEVGQAHGTLRRGTVANSEI